MTTTATTTATALTTTTTTTNTNTTTTEAKSIETTEFKQFKRIEQCHKEAQTS